MSRPPQPVIEFRKAIWSRPSLARSRRIYATSGRTGVRCGDRRLADPVDAGEARREQLDERCGRETHDVQVVAVDAADEAGAAALDRVGARATLPFAARHVRGEVARRQRPEL